MWLLHYLVGVQAMTESLLVLPLPELKGTPLGGPLFLGNKLPHSATILAPGQFPGQDSLNV